MDSAAPPPGSALLVFADDWGRHPSSCQHLVQRLLSAHRTCWVNTIGTRTPRLNWDTIVRGFEKLRHWSGKNATPAFLPSNLSVHNPKMWPWLSSRLDRSLNRRLLRRQLLPVVAALNVPVHAITTLPVVGDVMADLPVDRWIYYCVDDFSLWPGLDQKAMAALEQEVIRRADVVVTASDHLRAKIAQQRPNVHLLTHGVDLAFWQRPIERRLPALDGLPRPLVVFWGVVDRRMDVEWLRRLSKDLERGTIALAGPEADPDPALAELPRVVRVGSLPYADLPVLANEASALVMPYADLPVTRAMQPLKLKEYLATGKPAVARNLPANLEWSSALDLAATPEAFSALVRERLQTGLPASQRAARLGLQDESWERKAQLFEKWALGGASPSPVDG